MKHPTSNRDIGPRAGTPLWLYMATTTVVGAGLLLVSVADLGLDQFCHLAGQPLIWLLLCMIVIGELRPISVPGQPSDNGAATSLPFVFALVIHYGLPVAAVLQVASTLVAGTARRNSAHRIAFNAAQYTLSLGAADALLRLLRPEVNSGPWIPAGPADLAAVAAAGAAYLCVNHLLVTCAIAMHERAPLPQIVFTGIGRQFYVNGVLLSLAPLVVVGMVHSLLYVLLLALPLGALHASASLSVKREHQANHDELTGLANRKHLIERSRREIVQARNRDEKVGLLLLDLDRFKEVNDTLGHHTGDALLQTVAHRLTHSVRPGDLVARLGGDEFAVLLPKVRDAASAREVALRLRGALSEPVRLEGMDFDLDASIGIALYPRDAPDYEPLLQRADVAMYVAKSARTGVEAYEPAKDRNSTARLSLYSELRRGLAEGALEMHYQPRINLETGKVAGMEALARWRHPTRGLLGPVEFMPVVEQSNLYRAFTSQVLDITLSALSQWRERGWDLPVMVNLGARELTDADLTATVASALRDHGVKPDRLVLEVGESALIGDEEGTTRAMRRLRELGVGLALDDFGTGHFTLVQLAGLPLDEVNIDGSFVARLREDDPTVVLAAISLVRALGMWATAEGVQNQELAEAVREAGCHTAQGRHFAPPMPARDVVAWLQAHRGGHRADPQR